VSYFQAIVIGLLQGVTELFPVSSLGHSVLVPGWLGWTSLVESQHATESFYLAYLVALHVATAIALIIFFRREWARVVRGFFTSIAHRRIETPQERLAWLIILATIPIGVVGLAFEHSLRVLFAKPLAAAIFLTVNGVMLYGIERLVRRARAMPSGSLDHLSFRQAGIVGVSQIGALFAGISRSGITMAAGLTQELDHDDAAHFAFLLAAPVILAAGVYKVGDLLGHNGDGIRGQALAGAVVAGLAAYFSVRFLTRFFRTQTLTPFAVYCVVAGAISIVRFA